MNIQPSDWHEHDVEGKYVVDVFGRTETNKVVCVRITGFSPYFFVGSKPDPSVVYEASNKKYGNGAYMFKGHKYIREHREPTIKSVKKYDMMDGFQELKKRDVWEVKCDSLASFRSAKSVLKGTQYESNLPPFLRFFHSQNIGPASGIRCEHAEEIDIPMTDDEPEYFVDAMYSCEATNVSAVEVNIPMLVASYDLEMYSASGLFPIPQKDPIIQIGISYRWSNAMGDPIDRVVLVLGSVAGSADDGIEFVSCPTEVSLLKTFAEEIQTKNPDILCGYNIFGFDDGYIEGRLERLGLKDTWCIARKRNGFGETTFETKKTELASGKYDLRYLTIRGRLGIDLLLNMRREHSLDSFKLDSVASVFLRNKVVSVKDGVVSTKKTRGLRVGNYVRFELVGNTNDPFMDGHKFKVLELTTNSFRIEGFPTNVPPNLEWTFTKDDVEPHELFRLHREGGADGRARIANYCIQDCDLVATLMETLDTIVNARGMADVCKVPLQYVLTRGQGIKIFSAVLYYAAQRDQIVRVQENEAGEGIGYEGAIVLPPKIGMYLDQPISVLDFNSLYPTNMISYNLSPDTLVSIRVYDDENSLISSDGCSKQERDTLLEKGYELEDISYDNYEGDTVIGKTTCTWVQPNDNPLTVGILPKTLDILLKKRKEFKQKMEDLTYDESQRSVFNGLQLAYKVVANSVYGQAGSRTSPIRKLCVAACTTAAGRKQLYNAKQIVESEFGGDVMYGDTDSIFIKFPTQDLGTSIKLGIAAGKSITDQSRKPYKIAYEKTFFPFILFCRKRYVGLKYEEDPDPTKAKRVSMGIVLKRRDNAPIVKDVFGGALDILLNDRSVPKAQTFVSELLKDVLNNKLPLEKYVISKSLRDDYKNPEQIAHRVLADRMKRRDPGTAPKVGDRIQYMFVANRKDEKKQGDKIEQMDYVKANKLVPDTPFYITNQIQNPVAQLFALCIEQMTGYVAPRSSYATLYADKLEKHTGNEELATLDVLAAKERQLESMIFLKSPSLANLVRANTRGPMDAFVRRS